MNLRNQRNQTKEAILNGRFVEYILNKHAKLIDADIQGKMNAFGFHSPLWKNRYFSVTKNVLSYTHLLQHRFVDMQTRQSKSGKIKKHSHAIHNRIMFGHAGEIVRELTFGFTQALKAQLMQFDKQKL